jgi:hypothetical protein
MDRLIYGVFCKNKSINIYIMNLYEGKTGRMGRTANAQKSLLLSRYINSRPTRTELSEKDILSEVKAVRYKQ